MKLDMQVARCFYRLQSDEFKPLMQYLEGLRTEEGRKLVALLDDTQLRRSQGRAELVDEILGYVRDSVDIVKKLGG